MYIKYIIQATLETQVHQRLTNIIQILNLHYYQSSQHLYLTTMTILGLVTSAEIKDLREKAPLLCWNDYNANSFNLLRKCM